VNWLQKFKKIFTDKVEKNEFHSELEQSDWGRNYGWFIELDGKKIGELVNAKYVSQFWVEYKIVAYTGYENILFDHDKWAKCEFKFKNKHYPQYVDPACGPSIEKVNNDYLILMRALYL